MITTTRHTPAPPSRALSLRAKGRITPHAPRAAFLLTDTLIGITVAGIVATALALSLHNFRKSSADLADLRAATRLAEQVLTNLQAERTPPSPTPDTTIGLQRLATGQSVAGQAWVKVTVTHRGRRVSLVGSVPAATLPNPHPPHRGPAP